VKAIIVYGLSFIVFWTGQHTNGHRLLRRTLQRSGAIMSSLK